MAELETPAFDREKLAGGLRWLADRGVHIGTSSWKYEGWLGKLYTSDRYLTRGKVSKAKFDRECLREHAEVFSTVCVDAGYYRFPSPEWIAQLMEATPEHYKFTFKVADDITARTFTGLGRHEARAGQRNENFLNAELFQMALLQTLAPWQSKVGVLIFEFSHFHPRDFERGRDFMDLLDAFFTALPKGWRYAVEIRNKSLLQPDYFAMLKQHGVAHVFNAWTKMPTIGEQLDLPGSQDCAPFAAARLLLKQGRTYEDAVRMFSPYESVKEPNHAAREAAVRLIKTKMRADKLTTENLMFLYLNNRLEGCSLETIAAILTLLDVYKPGGDGMPPPPPPKPKDTLL